MKIFDNVDIENMRERKNRIGCPFLNKADPVCMDS